MLKRSQPQRPDGISVHSPLSTVHFTLNLNRVFDSEEYRPLSAERIPFLFAYIHYIFHNQY